MPTASDLTIPNINFQILYLETMVQGMLSFRVFGISATSTSDRGLRSTCKRCGGYINGKKCAPNNHFERWYTTFGVMCPLQLKSYLYVLQSDKVASGYKKEWDCWPHRAKVSSPI